MSTIITQNPYSFTVADNMNINAVFENAEYTINTTMFPLFPDSSVSRSITKTKSGDSITLEYSSNSTTYIYTFRGWLDIDNRTILSTSNPYTFTPDRDMNIAAFTGNPNFTGRYGALPRSGNSSYTASFALNFIDGSSKTGTLPISNQSFDWGKPCYSLEKVNYTATSTNKTWIYSLSNYGGGWWSYNSPPGPAGLDWIGGYFPLLKECNIPYFWSKDTRTFDGQTAYISFIPYTFNFKTYRTLSTGVNTGVKYICFHALDFLDYDTTNFDTSTKITLNSGDRIYCRTNAVNYTQANLSSIFEGTFDIHKTLQY